jgi:hypothetical protein
VLRCGVVLAPLVRAGHEARPHVVAPPFAQLEAEHDDEGEDTGEADGVADRRRSVVGCAHEETTTEMVAEQSLGGDIHERERARQLGEEVSSDVGDLNLVGAGVDLEDLGITGELLDAVLGDVAVAAEELHRFHGHLRGSLGGVELHG